MTELRTPRLRLVRATPAHLRAELESREAFRAALGVEVAPSWPPELYDADAIRWTLAWLEANPDDTRWGFYYIVEADRPTVIGAGGYKGAPDDAGTIEIGYGIVPERRRRGYAREAVDGWLAHAFEDRRVRRVIAHTLAHLDPSIAVLRSAGFRFVGQGNDPSEPSAVQYEITRELYDATLPSRRGLASEAAVLELLAGERARLIERVERVPEALRSRPPADGRWSIVQVLEHLARVESGITKLLAVRGRERPAEGVDVGDAVMTPAKVARARNRGDRIEAPERIRPTGSASPADALRQLEDARAALVAAFREADREALDGQTYVHQTLGRLTLRAWAEFVAHHEARHAEQIAEIADALAGGEVAAQA
jgi:[ribosomal protein S5]-alanine N-acetyltransferase